MDGTRLVTTTASNKARSGMIFSIFQQAWPVFLSQLIIAFYSIVDTLIVGHLSTKDLAAIGLGTSIFTTIYILFSSITFALIPLMSEKDSKEDFTLVGEELRQGFWLVVLISIPVCILLLNPGIFLWLGAIDGEMSKIVSQYLFFYALAVPAMLLFKVFFCFCAAIQNSRVLMIFSIAGLIAKIPLSYVWVYGKYGFGNYGAIGTAMSTCVVSYIEIVGAFIILMTAKTYKKYRIFDSGSWVSIASQKQFLLLGIPIGFTFLIDYSAITLMGILVANISLSMVGAFRVASIISYVAYLVPMSIGTAASAMVARKLGEGCFHEAHEAANAAWILSFLIGLCVALTMVFYRVELVAIFTSLPDVATLASTVLIFVAMYHLADALLTVSGGVLRGMKRTVFTSVIYGVSMWGIGLGGGSYLTLIQPIDPIGQEGGFFFSLAIGATVGTVLMFLYYNKVRRTR